MKEQLIPNVPHLILMGGVFAAVFYALNRFVFKPTFAIMDERARQGDQLLGVSAELLDKAQEKERTYAEELKKIRHGAAAVREELVRKAEAEAGAIIAAARRATEERIADMLAEIGRQKKEAELKLRQYSQKLARDMVDKILERRAS